MEAAYIIMWQQISLIIMSSIPHIFLPLSKRRAWDGKGLSTIVVSYEELSRTFRVIPQDYVSLPPNIMCPDITGTVFH